MKKRRSFATSVQRAALALGILAFIAFVSVTATSARAAAADNNAFVRVVHASPEAGTVDVFVDGNALLTNFEFSKVTDYVPLPAGSHEIKVAPAGKGASAAVITQTVSVNAGLPYTVAAIGTKDTGFSLQAFADNNLVPNNGMARVRVYHLSPNAGPVDVSTGGSKVITGLTYKNASDYLTVPPKDYTFNVTATQANATVPVNATLNANTVNSVFAVGLYNGNPALKFVAASVQGTPMAGMPNTGSDPHAVAPTNNGVWSWILGIVALLLIGTALVAGRFAYARNK